MLSVKDSWISYRTLCIISGCSTVVLLLFYFSYGSENLIPLNLGFHKGTPRPPYRYDHPHRPPPGPPPNSNTGPKYERPRSHPIDRLVRDAGRRFQAMMGTETHTLEQAAHAYRTRRGRHPPPGFDQWFKLARGSQAVIVEDLFDQIYEDLDPFWGVNPQRMRDSAVDWPICLSIRNGEPGWRGHGEAPLFELPWLVAWREMMQKMPPLPDVEMPVSVKDEPLVMVPFELMNKYMNASRRARHEHKLLPLHDIKSEFPKYPPIEVETPTSEPEQNHTWIEPRTYWDFIVDACRPQHPVHTDPKSIPYEPLPPVFVAEWTKGTYKGYVTNFTMSKNVCYNPNLRTLHGYLIAPNVKRVYTDLVPHFAVAKLAGVSNDILIPSPSHWTSLESYQGIANTIPWTEKKNAVVWRGTATGGDHNENNWEGFHRHRLIAMMNATTVGRVELEMDHAKTFAQEPSYDLLRAADPKKWDVGLHNWPFPIPRLFPLAAETYGKLDQWISKITNGGFTHFFCFPFRSMFPTNDFCPYVNPYYHTVPWMNTTDIFGYKYLPDIDGQTSSGRFRGFLQSLSVPIKATLFKEWHDSRYMAWQHFVPMTNEFQDWWGLLEYFIGYEGDSKEGEVTVPPHDSVGEAIGRMGMDWARKVERPEDVVLYFYRVILEYARIVADDRIHLGYIDDIINT